MSSKITDPEVFARFALAGNATFTIRSVASGVRFTYRVRTMKEREGMWFVSLLNGPDNTSHYTYMGCIQNNKFRFTKGSKVTPTAPSAVAIVWFAKQAFERHLLPASVEVWHEDRCGRCGRKLTVPESIASGIGPECAGKL